MAQTKTVKVVQVEKVKAGKTDRLVLHYELLDGPKKGEVWKIGALAIKLPEDSRKTLLAAKPGDVVNVSLEKEGNYWNMTAVEKAVVQQNNAIAAPKQTFDNVGIKVGAARNQAIAYLAAQGKKFTLDDVDDVAYEIIARQQAQENNIRDGNNPFEHKVNDTKAAQHTNDDDLGF